jgi:hypothetical protein
VVVLTQMASAQQLPTFPAQLAPGEPHDGAAQYVAGAQTADVPSTTTEQQPLLHCELLRHVVAQSRLEGSFVSKTQVLPLQHASGSLEQSVPGAPQTAASGAPAST